MGFTNLNCLFTWTVFQYLVVKCRPAIEANRTIREEELITRLRKQDTSALDYLYDHYAGALYSIVLRIVRNEDVAEEVLQDIFLKIWDRVSTYNSSKGRLFTWMLNIARNQAIDKTRSKEMSQGRKTDDIDNIVNKIDRQESTELKTDGRYIGASSCKNSQEKTETDNHIRKL